MTKKKKLFIGISIVVILLLLIVANLKKSSGGAVKVQTEEVKRGTITHLVSGSGQVKPKVEVKISANVAGKIIRLGAREGDRVQKGQVLMELDRTNYEAAVAQAKAVLSSAKANARQAKANMEKAQADYKRMRGLYEQKLVSQEQMEAARTQYEVAKAQYEAALDQVTQAEAGLKRAQDDLSKTTILSPIEGTVVKINKEVGEIALGSMLQADVIMIVADLSRMEVVTEIDETDVVDVAIGDTARIEVDAIPDTTFTGVVSEIAHVATTRGLGTQEEVTNFEVRVAILDKVDKLRPGMSATVDIETETRRNVLKVPIQAVTMQEVEKSQRGSGEKSEEETENYLPKKREEKLKEVVFVVKNGVARMRPVKTGITSDTHIEIIEGLKEGEEVVVGSYRAITKELKDGKKVEVVKGSKS